LSGFEDLSWEDMEHLVGKLFEKKGYEVKVTQKTGDFGIDVEAKNANEFIGIQVKHWKNNVGFDDCAKTLGVSHKYNKAIIISTNSGFTPQAWEFQEQNKYRLELWDTNKFREELDKWNVTFDSIKQPPISFRDEKTSYASYRRPNQEISRSGLVALFCFIIGIVSLFTLEHIWYIGIPFLVTAIMIPLFKAMWKAAGWASSKIETNSAPSYTRLENRRHEKDLAVAFFIIIFLAIILVIIF